MLAAADFSQEITTTVLWLNEFYAMDIRCIRLSPYRHNGRLLLDVQQVIPLPEAEVLMVRLRKRETAARVAKEGSKDHTKYVVRSPERETEPLAKRRAVLALVTAMHEYGVPAQDMAEVIPRAKLRSVPGFLTGDELWTAFATEHGLGPHRRGRWFVGDAFHDDERTWVLSNGWGIQTEATLAALVALDSARFGFRAAE